MIQHPTVPLPLPLGGVSGGQLLLVIGNPTVHLLTGSPLPPLRPFLFSCFCLSLMFLESQFLSIVLSHPWMFSPPPWPSLPAELLSVLRGERRHTPHGPWPCEVWGEQKGAGGSKNASISLFIGMLGRQMGVRSLDPGPPSFILLATLVLSIHCHIQRMLIDPLKINTPAVPLSFICECPQNVKGAVRGVILGSQMTLDHIAN